MLRGDGRAGAVGHSHFEGGRFVGNVETDAGWQAQCGVIILYTAQCAARADCGADAERVQERQRAAAQVVRLRVGAALWESPPARLARSVNVERDARGAR